MDDNTPQLRPMDADVDPIGWIARALRRLTVKRDMRISLRIKKSVKHTDRAKTPPEWIPSRRWPR